MLLRNEYTIVFSMPEEYERLENFRKMNDLSGWAESQTSKGVIFYKRDDFRDDLLNEQTEPKVETMSCQECKWWSPIKRKCTITEVSECAYEPIPII